MAQSSQVFESLETRRLLSVSVTSNGMLKVVGEAESANTIYVAYNDATAMYDVTLNGTTQSFDAASVRRLRISGGDEADTISVANSVKVRVQINGNDGDDILSAGSKRSAINGGEGNDLITGSAKSDTLRGGNGNDTINAGAGDDQVNGGDGDDVLNAGAGDNEVFGGDGADTITALDGDDLIVGGDGKDSIDAGTGDDDVSQDTPVPDVENCAGGRVGMGRFGSNGRQAGDDEGTRERPDARGVLASGGRAGLFGEMSIR
ncbi:MAG TPA: calcium-binding protein [Tepidisphaeraceae bacterium]|nr:calcium-binding protein [Tepidisphaeraceae bacterium]